MEKDGKSKEEREKFAPRCKEDVEKGIMHVLSHTNDKRKQILKIHFGVTGLSKILVADMERELRGVVNEHVTTNSTDIVGPAVLPAIAQEVLIDNTNDGALRGGDTWPVIGEEEVV